MGEDIWGFNLKKLRKTEGYTALLHPDDIAAYSEEVFTKHMMGEAPYYKAEVRMKHKDGYYLWVMVQGEIVDWDETGQAS